jgi:hypothetical protein
LLILLSGLSLSKTLQTVRKRKIQRLLMAGLSAGKLGRVLLQRGAIQIAARKPAIIVARSRPCPALVLLAADVSLAGLALGLQRVEFRDPVLIKAIVP